MQIRNRGIGAACCMIFLLFGAGCSSTRPQSSPTKGTSDQMPEAMDKKSGQIDHILGVINNLTRIASSNTSKGNLDDNTRKKIHAEVEQIKAPYQLVTLALMCRAILGSQDAGDEPYDFVFDAAFWRCVWLLSENISDDGVNALRILKADSNTDAGDTLMFEEAISKQRAKIEREKKQRL